jgi:hypothetical protein
MQVCLYYFPKGRIENVAYILAESFQLTSADILEDIRGSTINICFRFEIFSVGFTSYSTSTNVILFIDVQVEKLFLAIFKGDQRNLYLLGQFYETFYSINI